MVIEPRSVVHDVPGLLQKLEAILRSGWLTTGTVNAELERKISDRFKPDRDVVVVSHGTAALQLLVRAFVPPKKKVIVPVNTFSASPASVLLEGRGLAFCDVDDWLQLDVHRAIELAKKNKDIGGIMLVHIAGQVSEHVDELIAYCQESGIVLIEDACQAYGTTFRGRPAGALSDFPAAFSISPTKVVFGGQGGMIAVRDFEVGGRLRQWRDNGKPWPGTDDCVAVSGNYKLSDIEAAIVLHQLEFFDEDAAKRRKNVELLKRLLPELRHMDVPGNVSNGYKHVVFLDPKGGVDGIQVENALREAGIIRSGACYRLPLHETKAYAPYCEGRTFPRADLLCRYHCGLPVNYQFGELEMHRIAQVVRKALGL